jgi:lipopolysaccharide/colanic/teichoic acid biosynthesis glycosyltransferase
MLKRFVDVAIAIAALIILSPIILLLSIITAFSTGGRVIYCQERIGYKGIPFIMYKFVTMYPDAEKNGPALWIQGDPRQTPWGVFMRKHRFDELPQLWNIIKGDISFVGPTRPERKYYIDQLIKIAPAYQSLLNKKPGLVSHGIVAYGYASSVEEMAERMQYDLQYVNDTNPFKDFNIIIKAFWKVILAKGK